MIFSHSLDISASKQFLEAQMTFRHGLKFASWMVGQSTNITPGLGWNSWKKGRVTPREDRPLTVARCRMAMVR
jgi:hypothetical protein